MGLVAATASTLGSLFKKSKTPKLLGGEAGSGLGTGLGRETGAGAGVGDVVEDVDVDVTTFFLTFEVTGVETGAGGADEDGSPELVKSNLLGVKKFNRSFGPPCDLGAEVEDETEAGRSLGEETGAGAGAGASASASVSVSFSDSGIFLNACKSFSLKTKELDKNALEIA